MLNEEKIRLMAKAAAYEKTKGKKAFTASHYFSSDYISIHLIWSGISYTIAFGLLLALWAFYRADYLMANIHKMDLAAFGKKAATIYIIGIVVYLIAVGIFCNIKYKKSKKNVSDYCQLLKGISETYDEKTQRGEKHTAGGNDQHDDFTGV